MPVSARFAPVAVSPLRLLSLVALIALVARAQPPLQLYAAQQRPVVMRLEPFPHRPSFMRHVEPPRAVAQQPQHVPSPAQQQLPPQQFHEQPPRQHVAAAPPPVVQIPMQDAGSSNNFAVPSVQIPQIPGMQIGGAGGGASPLTQQSPALGGLFGGGGGITVQPPKFAAAPDTNPPPPAPVRVQQPVVPAALSEQSFSPRPDSTPPPPPPINIPTDVQNQLIKFFGLDSFGIPGLTGSHPNGFAGAVQEMRNAGIPVQLLPAEHVNKAQGVPLQAPQNDLLVQANPSFANELNNIMNEAKGPLLTGGSGANVPLPDPKPGENGLIGLLSTSIRKIVKDTGMADAISQSLPSVLGGTAGTPGEQKNAEKAEIGGGGDKKDVRRQQSAAERALAGFAQALGGSGPNGPSHAGLPRIPGIPLLPGGIPRNAQGQIDVIQLIGSITRRVSNGTTLADIIPPEQLQTLADNVTDALLPTTPDEFDLSKFMGRWFEGINSPRSTEQRCVVHHYGGLTKNERTATFTALKIYREGSEFGPVRYSIGYAFRAGNKDAMMQLHSSESSDAQPFWVYKLGPEGQDPFGNKQYEYAIVSNWVKYPVTVLVRDPDAFKQKHEVEVLRWLEDQGFINGFVRAFNLLQPASYSSCQYAENTFELFGKKRR